MIRCYDGYMTKPREPLSLYVHIPFCSLKCSYCDFNSYAGIEDLVAPFVDALVKEIELWAPIAEGRPVPTVFFGGGTPSLLPLADIERIMAALQQHFALEPDAEVSLEANPGTVDLDYLRGLVAAGVNRLSFGVQSFDDAELAALDRIHTAEDAVEGYRWAREAGFGSINLDLIYGLADQSIERWQSNVERAIELAPDHLSLYALTIEEGTKLAYDIDHGNAPEPDPDLQADMYEWSIDRLDGVGYHQYEISNWSRPGHECRHNLVYWRNGEWLALGPGAHAHWAGFRFADVYSPRQYIDRVTETNPTDIANAADAAGTLKAMRQVGFIEGQDDVRMADTAILALRLNEGLDSEDFRSRFGATPDEAFGPTLAEMTEAGLLERDNGTTRLTRRGRLIANEVFVRLLPDTA